MTGWTPRTWQIYFSEPLTAASATVLGNYSMVNSSGTKLTLSAVALSRDGTVVTLTTSAAISASTLYTITMSNLATVSGDQLPASIPLSVSLEWHGGRSCSSNGRAWTTGPTQQRDRR